MPVPLWYGLSAVVCMALGLFFAYRRWPSLVATSAFATAVLFAMSLWTMRQATMAEVFGEPLTKARVKTGVVYDIVGRADDAAEVSVFRTHLIVRERGGDPGDLRLFAYPGRPVGRAFTVEPDIHGIPTVRHAADRE